jgi:hypothetical protein
MNVAERLLGRPCQWGAHYVIAMIKLMTGCADDIPNSFAKR